MSVLMAACKEGVRRKSQEREPSRKPSAQIWDPRGLCVWCKGKVERK